MHLEGVFTALVTPFDKDHKVNYSVLRQLIQTQIQEGVQGLVLIGSTGECSTVTRQEQDEIIKIAVDEVKGKIPVIAGTGTYSTSVTIDNTKRAEELGADGVLIVTPYFNKPTSEGIYQHFKEAARQTKLPIIVYNIQGRTARNIDMPTMQRLADIPNIVAVKEASGNIEQIMDVIDTIAHHRPGFKVLSGDDPLTFPILALGGHGVISIVSNLVIKPLVKMVQLALNGDFVEARKLHFQLLPIFKGVFIETNPIPIKEAMNLCGKKVGGYRLPLCEMAPNNKQQLRQILEQMRLLNK